MKKKVFEAVAEANEAEIRRLYGEEAAESANIGWGQGDDFIESKVYTTTPMMVVITKVLPDGTMQHSSTEYAGPFPTS